MSKLAEKIRSATRMQPAPVGFGTARDEKRATLVLAGVARDAREAGEMARRGADVVILGTFDKPASRDGAPSAKDVVLGARIAGAGDDEAQQYREAGYDFVVFDPNRASAMALLDEKAGYVMLLPADLSETETRAIDAFQLDAIDVGELKGGLTVRRQIELQRIAAMTRKALMAAVPSGIPAGELRALRDTGVAVVATADVGGVEKLRKTIDALPPRSHRRDDRDRVAMVPLSASGGHEHEDDDDDE